MVKTTIRYALWMTTAAVCSLAMGGGCDRSAGQNARTALDAIDLACVFNSTVTNEEELARICGIAKPLLPLLRQLIGQREGAKRSGVRWDGDAGAAKDAGLE